MTKTCLSGRNPTVAKANASIVQEAKAINQSLTALGLVIKRLADRQRPGGGRRPNNFGAAAHLQVESERIEAVCHAVARIQYS